MKKKNNWAVFKDNDPKYKVGDVALYGHPRMAGYIDKIKKRNVSEKEKEGIKKRVAGRNCCHQGKAEIHENFCYSYRVNGDLIPENEIMDVGIDKLNKHIKELNEDYDRLYKKISNAASELGYNNY